MPLKRGEAGLDSVWKRYGFDDRGVSTGSLEVVD